MAIRLAVEDRYLAVKLAIRFGISPRYAWARYVKPTLESGDGPGHIAVRWELRVLEELGYSPRTLVALAYRHGVPWLERHTTEGSAWVAAVHKIASDQAGASLHPSTPPHHSRALGLD